MLGLTPNRVAAISSVAADAGAAVVALTGTLPHNYQTTAVLVAALLAKSGVVLKYLQGSQNWDQIQADLAAKVSEVNDPWPTVDPTYAPATAGAPSVS